MPQEAHRRNFNYSNVVNSTISIAKTFKTFFESKKKTNT